MVMDNAEEQRIIELINQEYGRQVKEGRSEIRNIIRLKIVKISLSCVRLF